MTRPSTPKGAPEQPRSAQERPGRVHCLSMCINFGHRPRVSLHSHLLAPCAIYWSQSCRCSWPWTGSYLPALFPPSSLPSKSRGPTPSLSHSLSPSLRASKRGHPYCLGSQPQAHEVDGHVGARVVRREPEEEHVESTERAKVLWQRDLPESQSPYFEQTNGGVRIFCVRCV